MYQALYRKWRPRTFDDVVGQSHITVTLQKQVETDRLSHAYLFIGTRGTGKTTCARILAKAVNCEHPVNGNPCNRCPTCLAIDEGTMMDVVEMDAASNTSVDDVRALRDEAIFSPAAAKKRVYIIDEVHMLSGSAFNALLKILEEPPEHLMFILCTTELRKVLPTIISRCQRHSFKRIETDEIAGRLAYVAQQEHFDLTPDAAQLLARLADGGMRDALSLLDQCSGRDRIDTEAVLSAMGLVGSLRIAELLNAILSRSPETALSLFRDLWQNGKDPAGILNELGDLLRDILLLQVAPKGADALLSGAYDKKTLDGFSKHISSGQLMDAMTALRDADLSGSNPRRSAELCLIRLTCPETGSTIDALCDRVSRLETALKGGSFSISEAPAPAAYAPVQTAPEPAPLKKTPPSEPPKPADVPEEPPRYTDEDAPPVVTDFIPPEPAAPAPRKEAPIPAPTAVPQTSSDQWAPLVTRVSGKITNILVQTFLSSSQTTGIISSDVLTIYFGNQLALDMVNTAQNAVIIQEELRAMTGKTYRVVMTAAPVPTVTDANTSPADELEDLKRFSDIVKFR